MCIYIYLHRLQLVVYVKYIYVYLCLFYLFVFAYVLLFIHLLYFCYADLVGVRPGQGLHANPNCLLYPLPALQAYSPAQWEGCVGEVTIASSRYQPILAHP